MGVIVSIIQTRCNCEGDEAPCAICKDTEKKIIAEIEKCVSEKYQARSSSHTDRLYGDGWNSCRGKILSSIKKLKGD